MMADLDLLSRVLLGLIAAAGLLLLVFLSWKFPRQVFWAIFLFRPLLDMSRLVPNDNVPVQTIINGVGVGVPAVLLAVLILRRRAFSKDLWIPLAFGIVLLVSALFHEKDLETGSILVRILTPVVFILFPSLVLTSEKDLRTFLRVVGWSTVFVLVALYLDRGRTNVNPLYGWVQDAIPLLGGGTQDRLAAVFGVPTMTAYWVFQFFAVAYFLFDTERSAARFLALGLWIVLLVPIYLAFSRATWIGCLVILVAYNVLKGRRKMTTLVLSLLVVAALVALPNILFRMQNPTTVGYRFAVWSGYVRSLTARGGLAWLTGMGFANLPEKNIYTGYLYSPGATGQVENSVVYLLAGAGVVAALLFILLAWNLIRRAWWLRTKGTTRFIRDFGAWSLALLAVWLVMGTVGDMVTYVVINWYWYAFFGCLLALWRLQQDAAAAGEGPPPAPGAA